MKRPSTQCIHIYTSGTTGSGKSFTGRVLIEEATWYDDLSILVLDPRNQAAGILVPEDRREILAQYETFGMTPEHARGFAFDYSAPDRGMRLGDVRSILEHAGKGRQLVSFKGMADDERCALFTQILERAFERHSQSESDKPRLLIVVEEAHRFTKRRVDDQAKAEAARAELTLDMIAREGRKFGICLVILSQTIRDFAYDAASIRANTPTKIFMHNSDREVGYAADFIARGKDIVQLQPATAIIYNPRWGETTVHIRPPYSKVWEFSPGETRAIVNGQRATPTTLAKDGRELLAHIARARAGGLTPIRVGDLAEFSGITSKRRLNDLLAELESASLITSRRLASRGRPRLIDLASSTEPDEDWTETDERGAEP